jgi:hypothetical protein
MTPDQLTQAIVSGINAGGEQFLEGTLAAALPIIWLAILGLHLGRPYILRTLRRSGLRLGADIWWMSYVLMRDGILLITLGLSWVYFDPNIEASIALPITGSLATLCLLLALAVKLSRRVDDDVQAHRLTTLFLVIGATLYYIPLVFAVEATSQAWLSGFGQVFTSSSNPTAALVLMWISLAGVAVVAGWLFMRLLRSATRSMAARPKKEQGAPGAVSGAAGGGE